MLYKFWNGKIIGVFYASWIFIKALSNRVFQILISSLNKSNLGLVGKNVQIMSGFKYRNPKTITIGDNVIVANNVTLSNGEIEKGTIYLNNNVSIDNSCFIDYSGGVVIKEYAHIAWGVYISTHDHGYDYMSKPIGKSLEIGEYAFIGSKSIILHNCKYIGKYAVVGAGSVVTKDVPDYAIVAGNPARIIKMLK